MTTSEAPLEYLERLLGPARRTRPTISRENLLNQLDSIFAPARREYSKSIDLPCDKTHDTEEK